MASDKRCKVCDAVLRPSDAMGHQINPSVDSAHWNNPEWLVCPVAVTEFDRDEYGFYRRRPGTKPVHPAVEVYRPAGFMAKLRKQAEALQTVLFDLDAVAPKKRRVVVETRGLE